MQIEIWQARLPVHVIQFSEQAFSLSQKPIVSVS